jgi:hypothetical protein
VSHSGCLISLNHASGLRPVGSLAEIEIELPGGRTLELSADLVRTDGARGELGMRFQPTEIDLAPLDRLVYATVKRRQTRED